jgi:hypothetical protein
MIRTTKTLT